MSPRLRKLLPAAIAVLAAALLAGLSQSPPANANTARANAYRILHVAEDGWRNWDFICGNSPTCINRTNVDWPMGSLFFNNAEIDKVKSILSGYYDNGAGCGTQKHARLNDGTAWNWDQDEGIKTTCCAGAPGQPNTAGHIRFYAAGDVKHDRMYNVGYGYWIMASAHKDHNEHIWLPGVCTHNPEWYGLSEREEHNMAVAWRDLGRPVTEDQQNWFNAQSDNQGHNYIRNNGMTSVFWVQ